MKMSGFFNAYLVAVLAFGLMVAFTSSTFAANATWNGSGAAGVWTDAANWEGTPHPVVGETATFNETAGNGYPLTAIPNDVNVIVQPSVATATVQLPAMQISNLTVRTNGVAANVQLTFSGQVTITSTNGTTVTTNSTGNATLDLAGNNLLGGFDVTLTSSGTGTASLTQSGAGGIVVDQITMTATVGNVALTSGTGAGVPNPNTNNGITASAAVDVNAVAGNATLTAGGNFVASTSITVRSTGAGIPSLIIGNNNLTVTNTLTIEADTGAPVFTGGTGTISVGTLDLLPTGDDLTLSFPALTATTVNLSDTSDEKSITMTGDLTVTTLLDMDSASGGNTAVLNMGGHNLLGGGNIDLKASTGAQCTISNAGTITAGTIVIDSANGQGATITQTAGGAITTSGTITLSGNQSAQLTAFASGGGIVGTNLIITLGTVDMVALPLDLSGDLTIANDNQAELKTTQGVTTTGPINIGGNLTVGVAGIFTPTDTTLTFDGTGNQTIDFTNIPLTGDSIVVANSGGAVCSLGAVNILTGETFTVNAGGIASTTGALDVADGLTILNGKLTTAGVAQTFGGNIVIGANGELEVTGAATITVNNGTANSIDNSAGGIIDLAAASSLVYTNTPLTITTGSGDSALGGITPTGGALTLAGTGTVTLRAPTALSQPITAGSWCDTRA
jgi:hypothetical protein